MLSSTQSLDTIHDFPHVGLLYFENSGENLLRFYLERIFRIKTNSNIKKQYNTASERLFTNNDILELSWIIASDFPQGRGSDEYFPAAVTSVILLVRNPVEVIMSRVLKESYLYDDALSKADQMIFQWKRFYKYWINAPIPVHLIRYEDLLNQPYLILKELCRFLLGIKTVDNSKVDYMIKTTLAEKVNKRFLAYDVEFLNDTEPYLGEDFLEKIQKKFFGSLDKIMKKFRYELGGSEEANWISEFNKENLVKSVEFHETICGQVMTSNYNAIKIS